ncbi:MAG: elongation factor P-like protein YeiP [Gammaproteobacteria bacterium]|nr:elongation factor P-like protein YeiP [Gammaproteobacteria bacterium]
MPKACDLKKGDIVEIDDAPHAVRRVESKSPSSRGAATLYKIRFKNLKTGQKLDQSLKGDDYLRDSDCSRVQVQYSYQDGNILMFMNLEDYSQYGLNREDLEGQIEYLLEGMEGILALLVDGEILAIELPQSVSLTIADTTPGVKGATATGRTKPATLVTGLEIQVPEYLESGELVKVNTATGSFISRA